MTDLLPWLPRSTKAACSSLEPGKQHMLQRIKREWARGAIGTSRVAEMVMGESALRHWRRIWVPRFACFPTPIASARRGGGT